MGTPGFIYILVNPSMEGLVKVGRTTRDPKERVNELSNPTGVPTSFLLVYQRFFNDIERAERLIHLLLEEQGYRISPNKEFFNASPHEVIEHILQIDDIAPEHLFNNPSFNIAEDDEKDLISPSQVDDSLEMLNFESNITVEELMGLADDYYYGLGDKLQDYQKAMHFYKQAASMGSIEAYNKIGEMYYEGEGCDKNWKNALDFWKEGVRKGDYSCFGNMAELFSENKQFNNEEKCRKFYRSFSPFFPGNKKDLISPSQINDFLDTLKVESGIHCEMLMELADAYYFGRGETLQDYSEALRLYKQAALMGASKAYHKLGYMYKNGLGFSKNYKIALDYFKEATKRGEIISFAEMADIYVREKQFDNAIKCWKRFFNSNLEEIEYGILSVYCYFYFEDALLNGWYLEHKEELKKKKYDVINYAKEYIEQTKESYPNLVEHRQRVLKEIINSLFDDNNEKMNLLYSSQLEELLTSEELLNLADANYIGIENIVQDFTEAFRLYKKASLLGASRAFNMLGIMYKEGRGVKQDYRTSLYYFKEGAKAGDIACYAEMASVFVQQKLFDSAIKCWEKFFNSHPESICIRKKCMYYYYYFDDAVKYGWNIDYIEELKKNKTGIEKCARDYIKQKGIEEFPEILEYRQKMLEIIINTL